MSKANPEPGTELPISDNLRKIPLRPRNSEHRPRYVANNPSGQPIKIIPLKRAPQK